MYFFNDREIAENDDKKRRSAKDVSVYQTESDFFFCHNSFFVYLLLLPFSS